MWPQTRHSLKWSLATHGYNEQKRPCWSRVGHMASHATLPSIVTSQHITDTMNRSASVGQVASHATRPRLVTGNRGAAADLMEI